MANKTITAFTASDGMADGDELLVWDISSAGTRKVPRSALYRLPTVNEAEAAALTEVTAWNAFRLGQLADARIVSANDVFRAVKSIKEGRGGGGTITGNTVAAQTVVTFSAPHHLVAGDVLTITESNSTPTLNGATRTVVSVPLTPTADEDGQPLPTTIVLDVNVTVAGTAGVAVKNSGATLVDDNDLQILMEPAAVYSIWGSLTFSCVTGGAVGGFKWNLSFPAIDALCLKTDVFTAPEAKAVVPNFTVTVHYSNIIERGGSTTSLAADEGDVTAGTGVVSTLNMRGQIDGGVAGGLFKFRWAQYYSWHQQCFLWPGSEIKFIKQ